MLTKPYNKRSMTRKGSCVMDNESVPFPAQTLVIKKTTIIGKGKEFHRVKPFPVRKNTIINAITEALPIRA